LRRRAEGLEQGVLVVVALLEVDQIRSGPCEPLLAFLNAPSQFADVVRSRLLMGLLAGGHSPERHEGIGLMVAVHSIRSAWLKKERRFAVPPQSLDG